eukprot:TRINITY_DN19141_c0_g1_i1.p1 TRINITY_DN19141_c0_g1~~TRINITY_DN19141_c0_g1_i1.p1  ORF type:complete len:535 (+),score=78.88 TRINITY_DN19141_c0_g1_i1:84-1607(+)
MVMHEKKLMELNQLPYELKMMLFAENRLQFDRRVVAMSLDETEEVLAFYYWYHLVNILDISLAQTINFKRYGFVDCQRHPSSIHFLNPSEFLLSPEKITAPLSHPSDSKTHKSTAASKPMLVMSCTDLNLENNHGSVFLEYLLSHFTFPNLVRVSTIDTAIPSTEIMDSLLSRSSSLRSLRLESMDIRLLPKLQVAVRSGLTNLNSLCISSCQSSEVLLTAMRPHFSRLVSLRLTRANGVSNQNIKMLESYSRMKNVQKLKLVDVESLTSGLFNTIMQNLWTTLLVFELSGRHEVQEKGLLSFVSFLREATKTNSHPTNEESSNPSEQTESKIKTCEPALKKLILKQCSWNTRLVIEWIFLCGNCTFVNLDYSGLYVRTKEQEAARYEKLYGSPHPDIPTTTDNSKKDEEDEGENDHTHTEPAFSSKRKNRYADGRKIRTRKKGERRAPSDEEDERSKKIAENFEERNKQKLAKQKKTRTKKTQALSNTRREREGERRRTKKTERKV